jgi:hypothetical protein
MRRQGGAQFFARFPRSMAIFMFKALPLPPSDRPFALTLPYPNCTLTAAKKSMT